jgi:putative ABC transport system substrate-binding protein
MNPSRERVDAGGLVADGGSGDHVMDRRAFIGALAGGLLAAPLAAEAQPAGRVARIGATVGTDAFYEAFLQGLVEAGWIPGQNAVIERRSVRGEGERVPAMVAELVRLKVDVILGTGARVIKSARKATSTIPIVGLDLESDPVGSGFVATLARPGGNITGIFLDLPELSGKQLQFLRDAVPGLARVGVMWEQEVGEPQLRATEAAARMIGITLNALGVRRDEEIRPAVERAARARAQALIVLTSPLLAQQSGPIVEVAQQYRLPTISPFTSFADAGALMAYGPSLPEMFRRAATYVDKILRGARPGELPVERPSKFELTINLKSAKALGLTIPQSLLARADQVIE